MGVIDIKVYATYYNEFDDEIHRLVIDSADNFSHLCDKLQASFPKLRPNRYVVTWKDNEGDEIVISNDEELKIALNEINDPIHKLYVFANNSEERASASSSNAQQRTPDASSHSSAPKTKHPGVVCDGCDKPVAGFRYKCLQCPDYDLCANCEAKNQHTKHLMIRMPTPLHLRSHHEKRMFYLINKFMRKASSPNSDEEEPKECPFKGKKFNASSRSRHYDQTPSWINSFTTYLNDWANFTECPNMENGKPKEPETKRKQSKSENGSTASSGEKNPGEPHVEFLKNIGETISQFLDPLGIDVNVQVKTDIKPGDGTNKTTFTSTQAGTGSTANTSANRSNKSQKSGSSQASRSGSSTPKSQKGDSTPGRKLSAESIKENKNSFISTKETTPTPNDESQSKKEEFKFINDNENSKADDWTLLDTDNIPTAPVASSDNTTNENTNENKTSKNSTIYPSLPNVTDNIWHSNPKIQRAVEAMMQMGFTNEGGWLTQLLVSKNGDISKVLDALQPTRN